MLSSRTSRTAFLLCASALASLGLASGASAAANPKLSITQFTAPNGTAIQDSTMLQMGTVRNSGDQAGNAIVDVTIDGERVARVSKRVKAHSSKSFDVNVPVGAGLATGTHQLDACLRRNAAAGSECAGASQLKVAAKDKAPEAEPAPPPAVCTSGARTLGDRNFPEQGNGGYDAQNYDIFFNYNTATNSLLADPSNPTHVTMTAKATQDLCDFALDFSIPASLIDSVKVNGVAAPFSKQAPPGGAPTCPVTNVSNTCHGSAATRRVVYPPADGCSPSVNNPPNPLVTGVTELHDQCPAMKLVIDPAADIANGSTFTVDVAYHGTPGVHWDPDGSVEGWAPTFTNVPSPGTPDGAYVVNEPIGAYEWMPVNNHPQDKATYDFRLTVPQGKTALGNGELVYYTDNPDTTRTWRWEMNYPMESAMATTTSGTFDLTGTVANNGIQYYDAFDSTFTAAQKNNANVQVNQHSGDHRVPHQPLRHVPVRLRRSRRRQHERLADQLRARGPVEDPLPELQREPRHPRSRDRAHVVRRRGVPESVEPHLVQRGLGHLRSYDYTAFQLNGTSLQSPVQRQLHEPAPARPGAAGDRHQQVVHRAAGRGRAERVHHVPDVHAPRDDADRAAPDPRPDQVLQRGAPCPRDVRRLEHHVPAVQERDPQRGRRPSAPDRVGPPARAASRPPSSGSSTSS